jgi:hypothetical protein
LKVTIEAVCNITQNKIPHNCGETNPRFTRKLYLSTEIMNKKSICPALTFVNYTLLTSDYGLYLRDEV